MKRLRTKILHIPEGERWEFMSDAQREIFLLVAKGYSNKEICEKKKQCHASVDAKKARAFEWLGIHCNADATAYALKHRLIYGTLSVGFYEPPK